MVVVCGGVAAVCLVGSVAHPASARYGSRRLLDLAGTDVVGDGRARETRPNQPATFLGTTSDCAAVDCRVVRRPGSGCRYRGRVRAGVADEPRLARSAGLGNWRTIHSDTRLDTRGVER